MTIHLDHHIAVELPGARAVFTTRRGGCSRGPYESLNLGRWTDDDPAAVEHNRASLAAGLGVELAYVRQVHGRRVVRARRSPHRGGPPDEADGLLTAEVGLAPMVLTADCLPIAVSGGGSVAMLHAGWRGLAAGIVEQGVRALLELTGRTPLGAAIGPGAGPCCYEVSDDVHQVFAHYGPEVRRGPNLDLKAIARLQLRAEGVADVHDVAMCTICSDHSLFFSHRREDGVTGRQAGLIWLS